LPRCQTTDDRRPMTADNLQTIEVYFKVERVSKLDSLSGQEEGLAPAGIAGVSPANSENLPTNKKPCNSDNLSGQEEGLAPAGIAGVSPANSENLPPNKKPCNSDNLSGQEEGACPRWDRGRLARKFRESSNQQKTLQLR
jgi:hypothetical protein